MNAVRVHVHVAERSFYEACDELGLLVFQDFPLQWTHKGRSWNPPSGRRERWPGSAQLPFRRGLPGPRRALLRSASRKWNLPNLLRTGVDVLSPRWALWQRRVLGPAVVRSIEDEDASRPVIDAAGHPLTTNHLYFGWYYGRFRDLERVVKGLPWPLAAADGIRGAGAPRPGVAGRDLAFRDGA